MNRKIFLWLYFLSCSLLFVLVPNYFPKITTHQYAALVFGYQERPFYLAMMTVIIMCFDYISLIIPTIELRNMQVFLLIRQPTRLKKLSTYFFMSLPYFVPFIIIKLYSLYFEQGIHAILGIFVSVFFWFGFLFWSVGLQVKQSTVTLLLILTIMLSRFLAIVFF